MADEVQAAPQVVSLTFDYDNRYAPTVRNYSHIGLVLADRLESGQSVSLTLGNQVLEITSVDTQSDGTRTMVATAGDYAIVLEVTISGGGREIGFFVPHYLLSNTPVLTATASVGGDTAPIVTTTPVETVDRADFQFSQGRIDNFVVHNSSGRSEMLLDTRSTQLAIVDFGALWCGPTQLFQRTLTRVQEQIGDAFDMKSVLFEAARGVYATTAEAAVQEHAYRLRGDIFTVSADDAVQATLRKDLGVEGFSPQLVIDQATGELLGQVGGSVSLPVDMYIDQIRSNLAGVMSYVESLADTPGIVRAGTRGSDVMAGSVRADRLSGGDGRDFIDGGYGNDVLIGGGGDDVLIGGEGDDILRGGAGNDRLVAGNGFNTLDGGEGNADVADYQQSDVAIEVRLNENGRGVVRVGDEVRDRLIGIEQVWGGVHDDRLTGSARGEVMYGGGGNDVIRTGGARAGEVDIVAGDNGDDVIIFEGGRIEADGGWGEDIFIIKSGTIYIQDNDTNIDTLDFSQVKYGVELSQIMGGNFFSSAEPRVIDETSFNGFISAIDRVIGTRFADIMSADEDGAIFFGGGGADTLSGAEGDDELYGEAGNDILFGGGGDDILLGGDGRDTIDGGDGDDLIAGGAGADILTGGAGHDVFVWDADHLSGRDTITDFTRGEDVIDLFNLGALTFQGRKGFTGAGNGEVRFRSLGEDTLIQVDIDGDASVDMSILLNGQHMLAAGDFILAQPDLIG
ncbi:calcium-binding protein [Sphingomonas mucosissima]|uniref:Bifunctional hemolysin/adenylate cyclase n=1 Tax=Sphingomonas mucosissima TaxID=370959 RepID=A0A245ZJB6_9SPHN|nr:M10 family metallopeptidase C-terminal domain-containing protein [Sphingomonas mucosissima]OWK29828.1 bifunctional hemolysin/adenylate cyclase precursor [Sphingomonas mucosissima]